MEATLLLFLGWLAAKQTVELAWNEEQQTYVEKQTGIAVGDLVRNFLAAVHREEETS